MNEVEVTVRGNVSTDVEQVTFDDGNVLTSFRLASNVRRWDANARENVTTHTMFLTVNCRRGLGANVMQSLKKGHGVVVHGRLKQQKWSKEERSGEAIVIDADVVGHDLTFGTSQFTKVTRVERRTDNAELSRATADLILSAEAEERASLLDAEPGSDSWEPADEEESRPAVLA